jgi:diguanylate cyclase (GGDEF)-like protein/putative nucleotidyltransferase with HDIG domain
VILVARAHDNDTQGRLQHERELLDAVRRHLLDVLGYDICLIDLVQGHSVQNVAAFQADSASDSHIFESLLDEQKQPLSVAHTLVAQKVKQTQKPFLGHAFLGASSAHGLPYLIVPVIDRDSEQEGRQIVVGLIRAVILDETKQVTPEEIAELMDFAANQAKLIASLVPITKEGAKQSGNALGQPKQEQATQEKAKGILPGECERVLIAHADRAVRRRYVRALSDTYRVTEVDSSQKVLEHLEADAVDLIILEGQMQSASGGSLCKEIRAKQAWQHIPIILIISDDNPEQKVEGLNAGADDCVFQSSLEAELSARVKTLLRHHTAERDLSVQLELLDAYSHKLETAHEEASRARQVSERDKQDLLKVKTELEQRKLEAEKRLGQDQLLHRISNTIRRSFNIQDNVKEALEALADYYSLDCCFLVLPAEESEDFVRAEYARNEHYSLKPKDIDLAVLETFKEYFAGDSCVFVSDVSRERLPEPFVRGPLLGHHVRALFYVPVTYEEKLLGILGGHKCENEAHWSQDNVNFFKQVADQVASGVTNSRLYACVQRQATTDGLTGLYNHRAAQERLAEQLRQAERYSRNLSIILLDIDYFKSTNDKYGHQAGDAVLKYVGRMIRRDCRDVDIPARYGGEEFLIVLPEVHQEGALVLAERIRKNLAAENVRYDKSEIVVSASFGVASYPDDAKTQQELLELADRAMYMSKRLGRNQVHLASDLTFSKFIEENVTASGKTEAKPVSPLEASITEGMSEAKPNPPTAESSSSSSSPVLPPNVVSINIARGETLKFDENGQPVVHSPGNQPAIDEPPPASPEAVQMVKALAQKLYDKSEYNKVHHLETARFAELLAKVLGLAGSEVEHIRVASLLHDVGILAVPEPILNKESEVTPEEMEMIKRHPSLGAQLLRPVRELKDVCDILEYHHEFWDGTGYPHGLKGEQIPLASRIVAIVDAYHALISDRPWRKALSGEDAIKELRKGAGRQFDPFLVDMFTAVLATLEEEEKSSKGQ